MPQLKKPKGIKKVALASLAATFAVSPALALAAEPVDVINLDQRIRILERQIELKDEAAAAKAKDAATVSVGEKGVSIKKGDTEFKFNLLVQFDARTYLDDNGAAPSDTFTFRRIRPTFQGTVGKLVGYRLTPEFATNSGAAGFIDAYIDLKFDPAYTVRAGKVKGPVSLERLQSGSAITFIERGFPSFLAPNRDLGVQVQGEVFDKALSYTVGYYNGTQDGQIGANAASPVLDTDNRKEVAARIFAEPFKSGGGVLEKLGIGIAGSSGSQIGAPAPATTTPAGLSAPSQRAFFAYNAGVTNNGDHTRISPQAYYYIGPFGLLGEYIESKQTLARAGTDRDVTHEAWQLVTSYILTGEDGSYRGLNKVAQPFVIGEDGWGAFEVAARYGELDADDDVFIAGPSQLANPDTAASKAKSWGVATNWYLNNTVKLALNYEDTSFKGGGGAGLDRPNDKTVFGRVQLNF